MANSLYRMPLVYLFLACVFCYSCSFLFVVFCVFVLLFCSHWSLVDVPLIFFWPADHVPDWQPRILLGMVEARSVNVKKTTTTTGACGGKIWTHLNLPSYHTTGVINETFRAGLYFTFLSDILHAIARVTMYVLLLDERYTLNYERPTAARIYHNPLDPCRARIVPTFGSPMVPTNNKEDQRSPVIRGETAASSASGAKPGARAQPISVLIGFILYHGQSSASFSTILLTLLVHIRLYCCTKKSPSLQLPALPQIVFGARRPSGLVGNLHTC